VEAIINLSISLVLSRMLNIIGVLIGTIIGGLYRTPLLVNYSNKNILERSNTIYLKKILVLCIPFVIGVYLSFILDFGVENFSQWIKLALILSLIVVSIYMGILYLLDKGICKNIIDRINKMVFINREL